MQILNDIKTFFIPEEIQKISNILLKIGIQYEFDFFLKCSQFLEKSSKEFDISNIKSKLNEINEVISEIKKFLQKGT